MKVKIQNDTNRRLVFTVRVTTTFLIKDDGGDKCVPVSEPVCDNVQITVVEEGEDKP